MTIQTAFDFNADVIQRCPQCDRKIIVARKTRTGVYSEFRGEGGLCFSCDAKRRKAK